MSANHQPRAILGFNVAVTGKLVRAEEVQNDIGTWLL